MFNVEQVLPPADNESPQELDEIWRNWARAEEVNR
jgi:hypothetical protein